MILTALLPSWKLALDAANKSPKTITSYLDSVKRLEAYLTDEELALDPASIRAFLAAERDRTSPASAAKHHRNLRVYFNWLIAEGEMKDDPMATVEKVKVPVEAKPFFTNAELAALLKATKGPDFESRRDHAIIRILIDTGLRLSGLANLRFDPVNDKDTDVFLDQLRLRVRLKGGEIWWAPIGSKAAAAIDRYLRARARSNYAASPWLWLGTRGIDTGHFADSGIRFMLRRRGEQAGVQNCIPHRFRHTFADSWLALGGNVDDLMNVAGWKSIAMPLRYAKGRGIARAAEAHKRLSPGDRL
jgi:site-specific recombinase XerD